MFMVGVKECDICNRNGCTGTIYEIEGSCFCNATSYPPCNYCETPLEYCGECGWKAMNEQ